MSKIDSKFSIKVSILALFTSILGIATAAPLATMDDYVWEIVEDPIYPNWGEGCLSRNYKEYQDCLDKSLLNYNQQLIKQWQLSDAVYRKLNQTIITIADQDPIILTDDFEEGSDGLRYVYLLDDYDADNNWLYLSRQIYEINNSVVVDLSTGFLQEFEGSNLTFSPDMKYAATVSTEFPGEEKVIIWKKDQNGVYQYDYNDHKDDIQFHEHLDFYNASANSPMVHKVTLEWLTDMSLLIDFYYKVNNEDAAAYRVRFNYIKPDPKSDWQLIPIK